MGSVVTEEFVPGSKVLVHVAENGHTFELDCVAGTPVETVQQCLESLCIVPASDQLLICGDVRLESHRPLGFYKLPCDGRDIFLYNRARLVSDCPPPVRDQIELAEVIIPPSPSASQNSHPLDDASDPALKALPSYERQFKYHFQKGHAIYIASQARLDACKRLLGEQQVQERALETARGNMEHYYKMIDQMYVEFMKHFERQQKHHVDHLSYFERDIARLAACKLHPAIQTEVHKTLLDFVREDSLRKSAETCAISHRQFQAKVSQLKMMYTELKRRVEDLFCAQPSVNVRQVEEMIKEQERYLEEQASIMQSLSKDVNTVKKLVDDCVSSQLSASLRPHDAVSALGPMYDVHDKNHLPRMEVCYRALAKFFDFCKAKKHEMSMCVHTSMQKVASLQSSIRDVRFQLSAFKEAMGRQDEIFADLKLVRRIGPAYRACLAEVVRRKAYMKLYMGQAGQLAEKIALKRDVEIGRREEFLKIQSAYIPRDVLGAMGLFDIPSQCVVNVVPFDNNLLDIDVADLERYAPGSLVGPLSKGDQSTQVKSSFSHSNSSCHSVEVEEGSVSIEKQCDSLIDEGCDGDDIMGTSKMEVENAWLKAQLASAIAYICSLPPDIDYDLVDDGNLQDVFRNAAQKTEEALHLKDEYAKHLQNILKAKQVQCLSYEKRIQELEQRLSDQYMYLHKLSGGRDGLEGDMLTAAMPKLDESKSETSVVTGDDRRAQVPRLSPEPMDEGISASAALECKYMGSSRTELSTGQTSRFREGVDENMGDFSGAVLLEATSQSPVSLDTSMLELRREEINAVAGEDSHEKVETAAQSEAKAASSDIIDNSASASEHTIPDFIGRVEGATSSTREQNQDRLLGLETALSEKTQECAAIEMRLTAVLDDVASLRRELEVSLKLLDESQMNCAHLENCLHEAREEAQTNLCAADRRATEYNALRASSVKLRGLLERLRSCIAAPIGGATGFAESIRSLALSLGSSAVNDNNGDDGTVEFRACIRVLAEKVGYLAQQRAEFLERCTRAEAAQGHMSKELEDKTELVKSLYAKHQMEKQVNKEKISFTRFEVHELAAFVLNSAGHYEAINRNSSNYYLSEQSIALFIEHLPNGRHYIIGQIVHIERNVARRPPRTGTGSPETGNGKELLGSSSSGSSSLRSRFNPYGLPVGTEYFVVTVAMVPDTVHSPHS